MATVSKHTRKRANGSEAVVWRVRWVDNDGKRKCRNFTTKKAADKKFADVTYRLETGLVAEPRGQALERVGELAQAWADHHETRWKNGNLERSTWEMYESHVRVHIKPHDIAKTPLKDLTAPACAAFAYDLTASAGVRQAPKVWTSFKALLDFGITKGLRDNNPAATIAIETNDRKLLTDAEADAIDSVVIPERHEAAALWRAAQAHDTEDNGRALAITALVMFCGLRISEVRGIGLQHVMLFGGEPHVKIRRRADRWGVLGPPKSKTSYRTVPLGPSSIAALRKWIDHVVKRATPNPDRLLFPTDRGKPLDYAHLYRHCLTPIMVAAGQATLVPKVDNDGEPTVRDGKHFAGPYCPLLFHPKYAFHDYRHVAASNWIAQGAKQKTIQEYMGHSSIKVTMDIYGHLWPDAENDQTLARGAEDCILNAKKA